MQRNSAEIFAEIAELEKYNPYGSRDTGVWFSEHDWDNEVIPCINEMKQKYNIPFDEIPESEQPVTDELVENKIIFFENPNELKKIDLDFHKIEIKQPTELQIKMSKSVKALNELVSCKDQFDPQDWKDYLYDEAVVLQQKTKSKKTIEFLPEIWDIIKKYAIPAKRIKKYFRIMGSIGKSDYNKWFKSSIPIVYHSQIISHFRREESIYYERFNITTPSDDSDEGEYSSVWFLDYLPFLPEGKSYPVLKTGFKEEPLFAPTPKVNEVLSLDFDDIFDDPDTEDAPHYRTLEGNFGILEMVTDDKKEQVREWFSL